VALYPSRVRSNEVLGGTWLVAIKVSNDIIATCTTSPDTAWVQRPWRMTGHISGMSVRVGPISELTSGYALRRIEHDANRPKDNRGRPPYRRPEVAGGSNDYRGHHHHYSHHLAHTLSAA
jgi:hypothetical protein